MKSKLQELVKIFKTNEMNDGETIKIDLPNGAKLLVDNTIFVKDVVTHLKITKLQEYEDIYVETFMNDILLSLTVYKKNCTLEAIKNDLWSIRLTEDFDYIKYEIKNTEEEIE